MGLNWKSVQAVHVSQACETLLRSTDTQSKLRGFIVTYREKQLPAKTILRMAYCLANNIPSETKLKFSSSESAPKLSGELGERWLFAPTPKACSSAPPYPSARGILRGRISLSRHFEGGLYTGRCPAGPSEHGDSRR
jgi:hypothetical protein